MPPRTQRTVYSGGTPEESLEIALNALDKSALRMNINPLKALEYNKSSDPYLTKNRFSEDLPMETYIYSDEFREPMIKECKAAGSPYIQSYREGGLREESIAREWDHAFDRAFHTRGVGVSWGSGSEQGIPSLTGGFDVPDTVHASLGNWSDIVAEISHDIYNEEYVNDLDQLIDFREDLSWQDRRYKELKYVKKGTIENIVHRDIEQDLIDRLVEAAAVKPSNVREEKSKMRGRPTF